MNIGVHSIVDNKSVTQLIQPWSLKIVSHAKHLVKIEIGSRTKKDLFR